MSRHVDRPHLNHTALDVVGQVSSGDPLQTHTHTHTLTHSHSHSHSHSHTRRQNSSSRSNRSATIVTAGHRRPIPSPLQATHSYRSAASSSSSSPADVRSPTLASPRGTRFPVNPSEHLHANVVSAGDKSASSIGRSRPQAPVIASRADAPSGTDDAFEEIKAVAARDALLEEAAKSRLENRKRSFATPIHSAAVADVSSASARKMAPSHAATPSSSSSPRTEAGGGPVPSHRTASLDSTTSSLSSSSTSQTFKHSQHIPQENITPQDIAKLVQAAGSPDAAILRLLQEKQSVVTHTDQMWRIMEKQRAMIFGLKSDLERALKDKDKYRKKLKDHLALSASGQSLATALKQSTTSARADSQSPTTTTTNRSTVSRESTTRRRKDSDTTDLSTLNDPASRSSTPQPALQSPGRQDAAAAETQTNLYSPVDPLPPKLPHAPLSASSLHHVTTPEYRIPTGTPPVTPKLRSAPQSPRTPGDNVQSNPLSNPKLMTSPQGFSSPKDRAAPQSRKAPPAPLNLSPQTSPLLPLNVSTVSDSEYDDDVSEDDERGRQKTRADDDRHREAYAMKERASTSKKDRKSKSVSAPPPPLDNVGSRRPVDKSSSGAEHATSLSPRVAPTHTMASMISHLRTVSDSDPAPQTVRAPVPSHLMSPGLPMSPRPGDRPMNSPMPRAPKQPLAGIPMSPRDGAMPLSPRAPRGPIPLPPQTPLPFSVASPTRTEATRAEALQQLNNTEGSRLAVPGQPSPEGEQPLHNTAPRSPGEIYRGLVSEQYPGLLLPPNALPSIFIKVDSSRLRPSRNSYMAPRPGEENPVFTLAIFARSDNTQLWRVEKTLAALSVFDQQIKVSSTFNTKLPDRALFTGHAPARIDARRVALGAYFESLLDTPISDQAAMIVCGFLTADAIPAEAIEYFPVPQESSQPIQLTVPSGRLRKDGYLTKRGKNFGGWKARYFVLDGPQLKYYEAPGGSLLGSIKLQYAQIGKQSPTPQTEEDVDNQYRHAFLILEPKRKDSASHVRHVLCAESDHERDAWVDCLLQYVDDDSDARKMSNSMQNTKDASGGRSPRMQKSLNDLNRPASSGKGSSTQGSLRSVPYQSTVAAEAPVMGSTSLRGRDTPSPTVLSSPTINDYDEDRGQNYPMISGPTNGTVISDVQSWGNKAPIAQTPIRDKKRSIFGFGGHSRGRASSDTGAGTSPQQQPRPAFGVPLIEAVEYSAPMDVPVLLPAVAYRCIEYLKARGAINEEGIFRLSGSNIVIKALRERFNNEGDIDLITDEHQYDVHAVASLLKQYLRELPANILTRELHFEFLNTQEQEETAKLNACNVLVNRLPAPNRELLQALTAFLREIVDNEKVNKMSVRNVGIVFAPTLNIPATLISLFVTEHAKVFGPPVDFNVVDFSGRTSSDLPSDAVRSPRKQMFSDLPTPAYGQTSFADEQYHQALAQRNAYDTGFLPIQQTYNQIQNAGESGFGSLNGVLAPTVKEGPKLGDFKGNGLSSKQSRRESNALFMNVGLLGAMREDNAGRPQEYENMSGKF